jgi:hypothetical protein
MKIKRTNEIGMILGNRIPISNGVIGIEHWALVGRGLLTPCKFH